MAPSFASAEQHLVKRYCSSYYYYDDNCSSNWYNWGRWVVLGVVLIVAFVVFLGLACISSRRRRRRGAQPMYGTGWMATGPAGQPPNQPYYGQQQPYQSQYQSAPAYDQQGQQTGQAQGYYGGAQGYYGQPVQSPPNAYQPGYAPPPGAPPKA